MVIRTSKNRRSPLRDLIKEQRDWVRSLPPDDHKQFTEVASFYSSGFDHRSGFGHLPGLVGQLPKPEIPGQDFVKWERASNRLWLSTALLKDEADQGSEFLTQFLYTTSRFQSNFGASGVDASELKAKAKAKAKLPVEQTTDVFLGWRAWSFQGKLCSLNIAGDSERDRWRPLRRLTAECVSYVEHPEGPRPKTAAAGSTLTTQARRLSMTQTKFSDRWRFGARS